MKNHNLSKRSRNNLKGVKPEIVAVIFLALKLSKIDFAVIDGVRSYTEQEWYFKNGRSKSMDSMHLIQDDGFSYAVDLMPCGFKIFDDITDVAWDQVNKAVKKATKKAKPKPKKTVKKTTKKTPSKTKKKK